MTAPALHLSFAARRLGERGTDIDFVADGAQLKALAQSYDLVSVERLEARIHLARWRGRDGLKIDGHLEVEVTQSCVVTLDPVANRISADFTRRYLSESHAEGSEIIVDVAAEDPPEEWNGRDLDLGAVIEEEFVLNLDPYPRKKP
jgi:uncharacterized metal-binding protein YceD (DUF177 family)